jgi:stage II sporulation protein R
MRRGITLLVLFFSIIISAQNKLRLVQSKDQEIPNDAIRLRVIANSNSEVDQEIKEKVRDEVIAYISPKVKDLENHDQARSVLYDSVEEINNVVNNVLVENNVDVNYEVDYGLTNFPTKINGDKLYPEGKYEAIYIVLGEGEGNNFWCVLFPPMCITDVTVNDGDVSSTDDVEYEFFVVEKFKELFGQDK